MKKIIIDTNALISFVTNRNLKQQKIIASIFEDAAKLKILILCPQNVLTEFVYVMEKIYSLPKKEIKNLINDFIATPGIEVVNELGMPFVLKLWPEHIPAYGDAIVASLGKMTKGGVVVTFDRSFRTALKKSGISVLPE